MAIRCNQDRMVEKSEELPENSTTPDTQGMQEMTSGTRKTDSDPA
jgi:hypothetical protein